MNTTTTYNAEATRQKQREIRALTRGAYDLQKMRIQIGLRIVANFKAKLGQPAGVTEEDALDSEATDILKQLRIDYKLITDGIAEKKRMPKVFKGEGIISDFTDFALTRSYFSMEKTEDEAFSALEKVVVEHPIYPFLKAVRGCGPALSGVIISEIDIHKAEYPSSLHMLAGLDVAADGRGRSRRKEHLVVKDYIDAEGEVCQKNGITYNPWLKTKLVGVLAGCMIKAGGPYADAYRDYKNRLANHPKHIEKTPAHRNRMAMRYMVKLFLNDLYNAWRAAENLPIAPPYHEAKLGIFHSKPTTGELVAQTMMLG